MDSKSPPDVPGIGRPLRVCHVIHSLQSGGAEESLVALARAAGGEGLEIEVLSLSPVEHSPIAAQLEEAGARVSTLGLRTRWDIRALMSAVEFMRANPADVVHTHLKHADIVGAVASRRVRIPMVSTLHVVEDRIGVIGRAKRAAGARARAYGAAITIAVSEAQRGWYLRDLGVDAQRVVTVHNGVPTPPPLSVRARRDIRQAFGVEPSDLMVAMVAIMRPGKGHEDILTLATALGQRQGVRFVLIGDGELRPELEAIAAANTESSAPVVFAGFRDDVPELLAASDIVVHPSYSDALPTALIHAIAAGCPTLAYAVGGIPEIVTHDAGILVQRGDQRALYVEFCRLVDSAEARDRFSRGARAHFEEEFTLSRWMSRLRCVYARAIELSNGSQGFA